MKVARKQDKQTELTHRVRINKDLYLDDSTNAEVIEISKEESTNSEVTVINDESSSVLRRLKEKQIENKKKQESNLATPKDEAKGIERYLDTDITIGLTNDQVEKRYQDNLSNKVLLSWHST